MNKEKGNEDAEISWRQRLTWSACRGAVSGGVRFLLDRAWDLFN